MKRLYIGLGISAALIIGGIGYRELARPEVNMVELSKAFYKGHNHYEMEVYNEKEYKLISIDDTSIKMQVDFKKFSGRNDISQLLSLAQNKSSNLTKDEKKAIEKFFNVLDKGINFNKENEEPLYAKDESVTYKWIEEPFNMNLTTVESKLFKRKNGTEDSYGYSNALEENGSISLSGNVDVRKNNKFLKSVCINGINGSGVLEVEVKVAY